MKAYNETWIRNKRILELAARWKRQGILSDEQLARIQDRFPVGFRESNGFIEIGLFVFTIVALGGSYFLLVTLFSNLFEAAGFYHTFNLLFGMAVGVVASRLIPSRQFYRSGVDNALVVVTVVLMAVGLSGFLPDGVSVWIYCLVFLPVILLGVWYYGDLLLTLAAFGTLQTGLFDWILGFPAGKQILPFVMMAVSVAGYLLARLLEDRDEMIYWRDCFILLEWLSLSSLLISANYFVVRQVNYVLMEQAPAEAPEIAWAPLFWLLTFVIPVLLLYAGFRQKERPLLIMGALGWGISLATWRYYHALFSVELYLVLNGLMLMGVSIALIRYLRVPRNGFTDAPDDESPREFLINAETLAAIQTASGQSGPEGMKYGGGNFGGGGSGSSY